MIKSITYTGLKPGLKFLVLGAIHGNEKCGTIGITRVMEDLNAGRFHITKGQVTFVPICNPRAYEKDVRYTERNLNRYLVPVAEPKTYEGQLGNLLCPLLADCDVVLDIHSYTVGGAAFASVDNTNEKEKEFAAILGAEALIGGWEDAYAATSVNSQKDPDESVGTGGYARRHGAMAVTLECGQHKDPKAPEIAYQAIRNALRYLDLTDEPKAVASVKPAPLVAVTHVFYSDGKGKFEKPWKNLEEVTKDKPLATSVDGLPIKAPEDGYIVLPKADAASGEEWFYFGVKKAA